MSKIDEEGDSCQAYTIIPAEPGWSIVGEYNDDYSLYFTPIIGWHVYAERRYSKKSHKHVRSSEAWPITSTVDDTFEDGRTILYKKPDGSYATNWGEIVEDPAKFFHDRRMEAERARSG